MIIIQLRIIQLINKGCGVFPQLHHCFIEFSAILKNPKYRVHLRNLRLCIVVIEPHKTITFKKIEKLCRKKKFGREIHKPFMILLRIKICKMNMSLFSEVKSKMLFS